MANELTRQAATAHNSKSTFLNLPGEIRNAIYNTYAEVSRPLFKTDWGYVYLKHLSPSEPKRIRENISHVNNLSTTQGLGQICQQVRAEYKSIYRHLDNIWVDLLNFRAFFHDFPEFKTHSQTVHIYLDLGYASGMILNNWYFHCPYIAFRFLDEPVSNMEVSIPTIPAELDMPDIWRQCLEKIATLIGKAVEETFDTKVQLYFTPDHVKRWMRKMRITNPPQVWYGRRIDPKARENQARYHISRIIENAYEICENMRELSAKAQWESYESTQHEEYGSK